MNDEVFAFLPQMVYSKNIRQEDYMMRKAGILIGRLRVANTKKTRGQARRS